MLKRVIAMVCMVLLWTSIGFAEANWVETTDKHWVDTNSIKVMQVDYSEIVKANTKQVMADGDYALVMLLINKDTKEYCGAHFEFYDYKGNLKFKDDFDPKDKQHWYTGNDETNEILKRVQ